jgi:hypothetical protein
VEFAEGCTLLESWSSKKSLMVKVNLLRNTDELFAIMVQDICNNGTGYLQ